MLIKDLKAYWIIDSRAFPTIKVVTRTDKVIGIGHAPSGSSKGKNEALELRDNGKDFHGMGVEKAIENINKKIAKAIVGKTFENEEELDYKMLSLDKTKNKNKIGGNATIACSISFIDVAAKEKNEDLFIYIAKKLKQKPSLPLCMFNIINGGLHGGNSLSIQEFLIVPMMKNIRDIMKCASEIYIELREILKKTYGRQAINVGYEGGFSPNMQKNWQALEMIRKAIDNTGYSKEVSISLDAAAESFYDKEKNLYFIDEKYVNDKELLDYYKDLIKTYNILSIEDPFVERHVKTFKELRRYTKVIGDDLTVTNIEMVKKYHSYIDGMIIKPNQVGSVTETLKTYEYARKHMKFIITSHRSGETESTFISDFAVGIASPYVKFGAPARGERTAKYNRLMEISDFYF